jgi:integrase
MRGSMREQRPGYWQLRVAQGTDPLSGRKRYRTKGFRGSKREAQRALAALVIEVDQGRTAPAAITMQQLLDAWLSHIEHLGRSPSTLYGYGRLVLQLPPGFLSTPLKKVTPKLLDDLYRHLQAQGRRKPATVLRFHTVIHAALHQAMRWEWIGQNPADRVSPPSVRRPEIRPPAIESVMAVLDAAARSRNPENAIVFRVLAATGCRRGEVCALQWADLDLEPEHPTMTVRRAVIEIRGGLVVKDTKTHAVRRVRLDDDTVEVLREHRRRAVELGMAAGAPPQPGDWVFSTPPGSSDPLQPDRISQAWRRLCLEVGLNARLHDLRHLQASLLLDAGESIATVSGRLGHEPNNNSSLLRRYVHMMPGADQRAAELVGRALSKGPPT